ncbi:MAG: hypothetical protein MK085_12805 [Phycisphaerales bacterium]|nr:hypothetical protein [Phycisphaerales bacterium]
MSQEPAAADGSLPSMGSRQEIIEKLGSRNTAPEIEGGNTLHGPGIRLDLNPDEDQVTQMLLEVVDEDIAWDVISRIARDFNWLLLDPMTGRSHSFSD